MLNTPVQYAIIRFMPFRETEEFANVGIVVMSARERVFEYKLVTKRHKRITDFFSEIDKFVYLAAAKEVSAELERCRELLKKNGFDRRMRSVDEEFANHLFNEIIKVRETVVRYSEPRKVLAIDTRSVTDGLFGHYVERNFVAKKSPEQKLESRVRRSLAKAHLADRFEKATLGDDAYHATFPFVEKVEGSPQKIIKPLFLAHQLPHKILDHCASWNFRVNELRRRQVLPNKVMFTVQGPDKKHFLRENFADANGMFQDAIKMLKQNQLTVIDANKSDALIDFAS
jgi:hypothetical protein